ncbi:hypothetical protein PybrP1_004879 [[Pythium] brassicae (nom. inval.)]|nr:hypothetical protein PybrP1_004879 [[Pythium] brassicae (nom. inval.)]
MLSRLGSMGGNSHHNRSMRSIAESVVMALGPTPSLDGELEDIEDVDEIHDDFLDHTDSDADTGVPHPGDAQVQRISRPEPPPPTWRERLNAHAPALVSVAIGAYVGVAVRVLLTELAAVLSSPQLELLELLGLSYFLPNAFGCFVMGIAVRGRPLFRDQFAVYFTGLTTGFCGSCTTFASWDLGAATMFVHGKWVNALLVLSVQVASAMTSFRVGVHVGEGVIQTYIIRMYPFRKPPVELNQLKSDLERYILGLRSVTKNAFGELLSRRVSATEQSLLVSRDACVELLGEIAQVEADYYRVLHNGFAWVVTGVAVSAVLWVLPFISGDNYTSSRLLAVCFGPLGAVLRYHLSLRNTQPRWRNFPLYTFAPNVLASILSSVVEVTGSAVAAAHRDASGAYADSASFKAFVLLGRGAMEVGFLGSLSTVSTWVNELDALSSRRVLYAYQYALASVIVSQLASVCVLGVYAAHGSGPLPS